MLIFFSYYICKKIKCTQCIHAIMNVLRMDEYICSIAHVKKYYCNPSWKSQFFPHATGQTNSVVSWPSEETNPILAAISHHSKRCCFRDAESTEVSAGRAWAPLKYTPFKISIVGSAAVVRCRNVSRQICSVSHWKGTCMMPYTRRCRKRGNSRARALQFGRITSLRWLVRTNGLEDIHSNHALPDDQHPKKTGMHSQTHFDTSSNNNALAS